MARPPVSKPPTPPPLSPEQEASIQSMPPHVRAVVRAYPSTTCWRLKHNGHAHYVIYSYESNQTDKSVTLKVVHGADSPLPGVVAFGIRPDELVCCNCGEWQTATEEQLGYMREHFAALERARAAAPKPGEVCKGPPKGGLKLV